MHTNATTNNTRPCRRSAPVVLSSYHTPAGTLQSKQHAPDSSPVVQLRLLKVWCDTHALLSDGGDPIAVPQGRNRMKCCPAFTLTRVQPSSLLKLQVAHDRQHPHHFGEPPTSCRPQGSAVQHAFAWRPPVLHPICHRRTPSSNSKQFKTLEKKT